MACFLVPAAEAVVTTVAAKVLHTRETECAALTRSANGIALETEGHIAFSRKLKWLSNLLWGGSALLAFEHVWHGEVTPWFPFLTAAANPADAAEMLGEMATVGVSMALLVTAAWGCMVLVTGAMEKRISHPQAAEQGTAQ